MNDFIGMLMMYSYIVQLYCSGDSSYINFMVRKMNEDLTNVSRWAVLSGLSLNASKTQATFGYWEEIAEQICRR